MYDLGGTAAGFLGLMVGIGLDPLVWIAAGFAVLVIRKWWATLAAGVALSVVLHFVLGALDAANGLEPLPLGRALLFGVARTLDVVLIGFLFIPIRRWKDRRRAMSGPA